MTEHLDDHAFMRRAIDLGELGRVTAPPNPWVGCVVVKEGKVVGEGFHEAPGKPHAEINALQQAGDGAEGATLYVTLEPCIHHGRTPPCVDALLQSRVSRVVIGIEDPDENVRGQGIAKLREAGLDVEVGVAAKEVLESLISYSHQRKTGKSYCLAKAAVSIDGRIAAADGTSQWITCIKARADAHQLRAESQAILIGSRTAVIDKPKLTVRDAPQMPRAQPLRVVLDPSGSLRPPSPLLDLSLAPTLIATTDRCPHEIQELWTDAGVEVSLFSPSKHGYGIDIEEVLQFLASRGILQVLVEGGAKLLSHLTEEALINRFVLYVGPRILGKDGIPLFSDLSYSSLSEAPQLRLLNSKQLGDSVRLDYVL